MSMHYRDLPEDEVSLFEPQQGNRSYGWFGYACAMVEQAIKEQHASKIKEAVYRQWITPDARTLEGQTMVTYCEIHKKPKSAEVLRSLGFA